MGTKQKEQAEKIANMYFSQDGVIDDMLHSCEVTPKDAIMVEVEYYADDVYFQDYKGNDDDFNSDHFNSDDLNVLIGLATDLVIKKTKIYRKRLEALKARIIAEIS